MTDNLTTIIHELSDRVFALINRIVDDRDEALDLTQDVFVKVLQEQNSGKVITRVRPYVFRTAFNRALNAKRNRSRRTAGNRKWQESLPDSIAAPQEMQQDQIELKEKLERLADRQREALTLRFYGQLSLAEIAETMNIAEGSVRVHITRGLQNLKESLAEVPREEKS